MGSSQTDIASVRAASAYRIDGCVRTGPIKSFGHLHKDAKPTKTQSTQKNKTRPVFRRSQFDHLSCSQFCALGNVRELSIKSVAIFMCDTYIRSVLVCVFVCVTSNRWNMAPSESHTYCIYADRVCVSVCAWGNRRRGVPLSCDLCSLQIALCAQNLCYVCATARSGPNCLS